MWMWILSLFRRCNNGGPYEQPEVDRQAILEDLWRNDPEFARVREVHEHAKQALIDRAVRDGIAIRREREFWTRSRTP